MTEILIKRYLFKGTRACCVEYLAESNTRLNPILSYPILISSLLLLPINLREVQTHLHGSTRMQNINCTVELDVFFNTRSLIKQEGCVH